MVPFFVFATSTAFLTSFSADFILLPTSKETLIVVLPIDVVEMISSRPSRPLNDFSMGVVISDSVSVDVISA